MRLRGGQCFSPQKIPSVILFTAIEFSLQYIVMLASVVLQYKLFKKILAICVLCDIVTHLRAFFELRGTWMVLVTTLSTGEQKQIQPKCQV